MRLGRPRFWLVTAVFFCSLTPANAASVLADTRLPLIWALPFTGMLLSLALLPQVLPEFWHRHFGKVSAFWAFAFLLPFALAFGFSLAAEVTLHAILTEFIPFIIILFALYTVAGGLFLKGNLHGSAAMNTALLAFGSALASVIGTAGASMVLILPLIRANDHRRNNAHVFVFFIFLVANIGGALTPLGDPPLFLGYLKGVSFFWPAQYLFLPTLLCVGALLAVFFALDSYFFRLERTQGKEREDITPDTGSLKLHGTVNLAFIVMIIATVLLTAELRLGSIDIIGTRLQWNNVMRDVALVSIALLSLWLTPKTARDGNEFAWGPILEIAKLFATIFLTAAPVLAILQNGEGALSQLANFTGLGGEPPNNAAYFWVTGLLSAFLDNAPAYLVFFQLAGGDAAQLMSTGAVTLAAISCGAVFMGAFTYIGNAPNFMVRAIAERHGVSMPSFTGYIGWSSVFLLPLFVLLTYIFFI